MKEYPIHIDKSYSKLNKVISNLKPDRVAVLVDKNTKKHCLPRLKKQLKYNVDVIIISPGENYKTIETVELIWKSMLKLNMTRKSLLINLGGGVIGDMGGFAASTFMRGMAFIQAPTTLLSMVDASVGGKLGVDFEELKNLVGLFNSPHCVWVDTKYLKTLPRQEIKSGYAEVLKHSLIADKAMWSELSSDEMPSKWSRIVEANIGIKAAVVEADPYEGGMRKILNYGHTVGHAMESHFLLTDTPLLHGYAVAIGMMVENELSANLGLLSLIEKEEINTYLESIYPCTPLHLTKSEVSSIVNRMTKDKKNANQNILMSLLQAVGTCGYDTKVSKKQIKSALKSSGVVAIID